MSSSNQGRRGYAHVLACGLAPHAYTPYRRRHSLVRGDKDNIAEDRRRVRMRVHWRKLH